MSDIEDTKKKSEIERAFNIVSNAAEKRGEELKKLEENAKTIENKLKIYEAKDKLNIKNIESRDKYIIVLHEQIKEYIDIIEKLKQNSKLLIESNESLQQKYVDMKDRILNTRGFEGHSKKITMYNLLREIYDNSKEEIRSLFGEGKNDFYENFESIKDTVLNLIADKVSGFSNEEASIILLKLKDSSSTKKTIDFIKVLENDILTLMGKGTDSVEEGEVEKGTIIETIIKRLLKFKDYEKTYDQIEEEEKAKKTSIDLLKGYGDESNLEDLTIEKREELKIEYEGKKEKLDSEIDSLITEYKKKGVTDLQLKELKDLKGNKNIKELGEGIDRLKQSIKVDAEENKKEIEKISSILSACEEKYEEAKQIPFFVYNGNPEDKMKIPGHPDIGNEFLINDLGNQQPFQSSKYLRVFSNPVFDGSKLVPGKKLYTMKFILQKNKFFMDLFGKKNIISNFQELEDTFKNILNDLGHGFHINSLVKGLIDYSGKDRHEIYEEGKMNLPNYKILELFKEGYPDHKNLYFTVNEELPTSVKTTKYKLFDPATEQMLNSDTGNKKIKAIEYSKKYPDSGRYNDKSALIIL